jgi:hypothetical protein
VSAVAAGRARLGDRVQDTITGLKGIVICEALWLNNCRRLTVQPEGLQDGKPVEMTTIDVEQLKVLKRNAAGVSPSPTGGPTPGPERAKGPTRF